MYLSVRMLLTDKIVIDVSQEGFGSLILLLLVTELSL